MLERFSAAAKGLVVTDPEFPVTVNIATMLAGIHDLLIVSPALAEELSDSFPLVEDLRGRWSSKVEAYRWAREALWSGLRRDILAIRYPDSVRDRDYIVQFRIFTFWISGDVDGLQPGSDPDEEMRFAAELFAETPANCPVMGYPYAGEGIGPGEGGGVALATRYGKYIVCDCPNLSVHSGVPAPRFEQRPPRQVELDDGKVYVSFIISDGDNLNCWDSAHQPLWNAACRGQVALGWNVMPGCWELIPDMLAHYYETASDNDCFIACGGGVGYANPHLYASRTADPEGAHRDYVEQTSGYLEKLDIDILNPYHMGYEIDHQNIADFKPLAEGYPAAKEILRRYLTSDSVPERGFPRLRPHPRHDLPDVALPPAGRGPRSAGDPRDDRALLAQQGQGGGHRRQDRGDPPPHRRHPAGVRQRLHRQLVLRSRRRRQGHGRAGPRLRRGQARSADRAGENSISKRGGAGDERSSRAW